MSGYVLIFPFYGTDIETMQNAEMVHGIIAMLFIAAMLGHIYIGTIGMEGAFEAMGRGTVDLNWAKEHHDLWLEEEGCPRPARSIAAPPGGNARRIAATRPTRHAAYRGNHHREHKAWPAIVDAAIVAYFGISPVRVIGQTSARCEALARCTAPSTRRAVRHVKLEMDDRLADPYCLLPAWARTL